MSFLLFSGVLEFGYSINDKWDIAIALEEEATFVGDYDINVVSLEPYARFTFAKAGIASFFVDGGIGIGCEYVNYEGEMLDNTFFENDKLELCGTRTIPKETDRLGSLSVSFEIITTTSRECHSFRM